MEDEELEALSELREFQFGQNCEEILSEDTLICECKCLSVKDIREALITGNIKTVDFDFLREHLGLGSGCSSCFKNRKSWEAAIF